jgi:hypothetical protein
VDDDLLADLDAGRGSDDHQQPEFVIDLPEVAVFQRGDHRGPEDEREATADGNAGGIPHDQQGRSDQKRPTHAEEAKQDPDQQAEADKQRQHRQTESEYVHLRRS